MAAEYQDWRVSLEFDGTDDSKRYISYHSIMIIDKKLNFEVMGALDNGITFLKLSYVFVFG